MPSDPLERADLRGRVEQALVRFLEEQSAALTDVSNDLAPAASALADFVLRGGKRLRPAFCYWGWRAAGGLDGAEIVRAAAALEFVHACALIHDDVIDASATRRGRPSVHRFFAEEHSAQAWSGESAAFGRAIALLVGDLALVWADVMFNSCGLASNAVDRARPAYDELRLEVSAGQLLDVIAQARRATDVQTALAVARYKSAKYTVERPLHVGALLADAPVQLTDAFSTYGLALGEAFQLRDDVLGVFGDPGETGKPAGDDIREGKRTALIAVTVQRATESEAAQLQNALGNATTTEADVCALRDLMVSTGALDAVEKLIAQRVDEALAAIETLRIDEESREVLSDLAVAATSRRV